MHRANSPETEKHYSVEEIAGLWSLSRDTIRKIFLEEPGVLVHTRPGSKYRRSYRTLRIPRSVMVRVYGRMTSRAA
jgi:hypothetical protein